ncbi:MULTISPECIES: helix-turn-helix transcriptional regulator [unclassified Lysinibacillus]|uniref:helix-turn-helix transcriptional regulator n=1 Tax=unclassified Lysinibacillus TaxID=2636778 RepID=UPI0025555256|nr:MULTISPECIES: helix-turn-helix transcriptional regulator [unclassified Lysinibacillus]MDM5248365.1 helix-turn-helix transcriptional regulator [Lysinibacillus sp. G4S2]
MTETRFKQAMKNQFQKVQFTEKHREAVRKGMHEELSDQVLLPLLQTMRTGYEITQLLYTKNKDVVHFNEGMIYASLHRLEQQQLVVSEWHENEKRYVLSHKGIKLLTKLNKETEKLPSLQQLLKEMCYAND